MFGWILTRYDFPSAVTELLLDFTSSKYAALLIMMTPFYVAYIVSLFFLSAFPQISLFLPNLLKL